MFNTCFQASKAGKYFSIEGKSVLLSKSSSFYTSLADVATWDPREKQCLKSPSKNLFISSHQVEKLKPKSAVKFCITFIKC